MYFKVPAGKKYYYSYRSVNFKLETFIKFQAVEKVIFTTDDNQEY